MSDKNFKAFRKQLRNIVQEILPLALNEELTAEMYTRISAEVNARMDRIEAHTKKTLEDMDQRAKDVQAYVIRTSAQNVPTDAAAVQAAELPAVSGQ